jgi:hypothetical protein
VISGGLSSTKALDDSTEARREKDFVRYAYPLPLPGMAAMFTRGRKHGYTSAVDRVVVRVRVLQARPDDALPSWDEVASRWNPAKR